MSRIFCPSSIHAAFVAGEAFLGSKPLLTPVNSEQKWLLDSVFSRRDALRLLKPEEMNSWADNDAKRLNAVLKAEGMDIKLDEFKEDGFGIVGVTHVGVEWVEVGTKAGIMDSSGKIFSAVHMLPHTSYKIGNKYELVTRFEVLMSGVHAHPVVCLFTKTKDRYYLTVAEEEPIGDVELCRRTEEIRSSLSPTSDHYEFLIFPMVDLDISGDIDWLKGIGTKDFVLDQAKKQAKFKMNHEGAVFKDAFAGGFAVTSTARPKFIVINQPFLLWSERDGVPYPLLSAYIDQEHWKDPGNLSL